MTPKVQTLLSQYLKTIASYYYKKNSNFNYLFSSQDTQLSAIGKLSKQDKHANSREFNPKTNQKLLKKKSKHESTRAKYDSSYEKIKNTHSKDMHENPMRCSSLKWSVFLSHTKKAGF